MVTAFATIANDGVRNQPHIIKEIRHSDDQPKTVTQAQQTQVITAETAQNLKTMLRQVVLDGTGRRAQLNGYTVAGKSGTAWKFNAKSKSVDSSKYVSSFIGMAPADNPQIVVAVVMDEPQVGARDGGMVSAPVFREIAQEILQEMKVPTDSAVKPAELVAKDIPEAPEKGTAGKKGAFFLLCRSPNTATTVLMAISKIRRNMCQPRLRRERPRVCCAGTDLRSSGQSLSNIATV